MAYRLTSKDRAGLIRPAVDAHSLGLAGFEGLLRGVGIRAIAAGRETASALDDPEEGRAAREVERWVRAEGLSAIGFSYRLDPRDALRLYGRLDALLDARHLRVRDGGPIAALYFAGLPEACALARERFPRTDAFFMGDEDALECLALLGLEGAALPAAQAKGLAYDEARMAFGRDLVRRGDYLGLRPPERSYPGYGDRGDGLIRRVDEGRARGLPPLLRAHVGPYLPDRAEAVRLFLEWTCSLARGGFLDVLSIGNSQLSQAAFGEDWDGLPDGGGVPLNSEAELREVWRAARPMLVRCYAGTKGVPALARLHEANLDIAWHALSLWWFCALDGRGPNPVLRNLEEHLETLRYIARTGKPFEPNVSHHFSFRGADDASAVAATYLACKAAKLAGVKTLVLQTMMNTPKGTWGIQDLAKARATFAMARGLEDGGFRVLLQPRAGLAYFSPDPDKARAQLAAATALMDDIEPGRHSSPDIIHVVAYSEALRLADPPVIEEGLKITLGALADYRAAKARGEAPDPEAEGETPERARALEAEARTLVASIEASIPDPYSAGGLYAALARGYFALPALACQREEYARAAAWTTALVDGGVRVVDPEGKPIGATERVRALEGA